MSNAMGLLDACRSPIRRQIMILAEETVQGGNELTATSVSEILDITLAKASYHVKELRKAGALEETGGRRVRGAYQTFYVPSETFQATMTDTVALDQIAEALENEDFTASQNRVTIAEIVRASGRPVEA